MAELLNLGTQAPNFSLETETGKSVNLQDFLGKKHVVLAFYPKDDTPG